MELGRILRSVPSDPATATTVVCVLLAAWLLYRFLRQDEEQAVDFTVTAPEQCKPGWKGRILDEPTIKVEGSTAIQCYAPATGQFFGLVNPTTQDGIDRVIEKASKAQVEWAKTSFTQRRRVLKTLLKFLFDNQEPIARAACLDSGKTRVDALLGEILVTAEKLKWTIDHGEKALKPESRPTSLLMFYKKNEVRYEPLGVVAASVSWNYPFHNLMGPIISALFSGNAIVVKGSEQTAWSSAYFINIVRSALAACGHDYNLVHSISCWPQTAGYLTSHPGISHLTFIGSKPVAHEIAKDAAKSLTPVCVELGGKDAAIVLDDPAARPETPEEMHRVCSTIMRGVFQSTGQNCIGIERIIAMPQAYHRLTSLMKDRIKRLRLGNELEAGIAGEGVDVGAMISSSSFSRLENLINDAVAQGAKLVVGGRRYEHPKYPKGHYFQPTMLIDVTPDMRIAQEELFAPVCLFMRAESAEHATQIANSTIYGLGCSIFGPVSRSSAKAQLEKAAKDVKAGMVALNDFAVFYMVQLPFGGMKGSGYGRFAGEEGLRSLCNVKSVCADRFPPIYMTTIPEKLDYPMGKSAWPFGRGIVEVGYGESWTRRWQGIKNMLR
ncbi:Meiotic Sister-Chromatid recombination aldehyde dehydrogenase [Vermiconidia calcicola]|uniref:Meiotic Sister-Chromatid recombination aldehyde dehydrogenase n=1 Tax=Vermiconidia calcicola TaxID=1690605 RepID=A0ACC3MN42_9PEZI|nr:Meiotic Sister-Chromatid recombination aldehyde dehydrogenase [Vermiconidia calcicola]